MILKFRMEKVLDISIHPAFYFFPTLQDKKDNLYLYTNKSDLR
jgi:hypothetical protein